MARLKVAAGAVAAAVLVAIGGWWFVRMPGPRHTGPLPAATPAQVERAAQLRVHVQTLAGDLKARDIVYHPDRVIAASEYVEGMLIAAGYRPEREAFFVGDRPAHNVVVTIEGSAKPEELLVVGAHYDTEPGTPGADDNASGVAALIELARALAGKELGRSVQLVAFANEEAPYFGTIGQGAMVRSAALLAERRDVVGMLSLESIGYYDDRPGSQHYPSPFDLLYPDTGDFVAFIGDLRSRSLVRRSIRAFREGVAFPSEGAAVPASVPGVSWSDHAAFWTRGWPAVMVTGTAPFRNPHYHQPTDTPDTLDYDRLSRVVDGVIAVVETLANE